MKCNAVILASIVLGQSVMASNIYRPGGHYQVRVLNGSEPSFPSGTGPSSGFARPTGKPHHVSSKKHHKTKSSTVAGTGIQASVVVTASPESASSTSIPGGCNPAHPGSCPPSTSIPGGCNPAHPGSCPSSYFGTSGAAATTTPVVVVPTSVAPASSSKAPVNSLPPYPTTFATSATSIVASTGFATGTGGAAYPSSTAIAAYYQCGGINYTGATNCVEGTYCKYQNPFYYQCVYQSY